jgi:hypothetical protein
VETAALVVGRGLEEVAMDVTKAVLVDGATLVVLMILLLTGIELEVTTEDTTDVWVELFGGVEVVWGVVCEAAVVDGFEVVVVVSAGFEVVVVFGAALVVEVTAAAALVSVAATKISGKSRSLTSMARIWGIIGEDADGE